MPTSPDIMGVPLKRLEEPIRTTLTAYQARADNGLSFDCENAGKLALTPDKPNSARSVTDALLQGEKVGTLYVIAFKPGDGTGSEESYQLSSLTVDAPYPRSSLVVPRNKTGIHGEAHLAILSHKIDDSHAEPRLYIGTFDLLGLKGSQVKKIGELGPPETTIVSFPYTTLTVGYMNPDGTRLDYSNVGSRRFGDPHAVYSRISDDVQVCAFLAISNEVNSRHPNLLPSLFPIHPRQLYMDF